MRILKSQIRALLTKNHRDRRGRLKSVTALVVLVAFVAVSIIGTTGFTGTAMADDTYCCGLEEHIHSAECYSEDGSMLCCDIPEHIHTDECLTGQPADEEIDAESAELTEQTADEKAAPETMTYTAGSGGVEVAVCVPSDALPEDAQLQVILYDEGSYEYERALSLTENAVDPDDNDAISTLSDPGELEEEDEGEEIPLSFSIVDPEDIESGSAVMDIFFLSGGAEVEPESSADVTIDASGLLAACDNPVESLEVWHLAETEDGTEPVLVADISDPETAADGVAEFTVESFSEFEFHYTCSAGGWAGFGANLIDENGDTISATVTGYNSALTGGRYTTTVDMPYTFTIEEFVEHFDLSGAYDFQYATVTDPNYGDEEHTFDVWQGEEQVGGQELYGSEENPVVSVTIDGTATTENPNYNTENVVSKTWHFTLTYENGTSVTIPIYGNADGANDSGGKYCPKYLELNLYFEAGFEVVLNLGNGNGTYSDGDYTGSSSSSGGALRYGSGNLKDYVDEDGVVTINLPSDDDLAKENNVTVPFTVVDETGDLPAVTVELGKEQAYDYKLIGWINIATGKYYDVSKGSTTAKVDLSDNNVFYADWIAASYDHGSAEDDGLRDDTVSTSSFVTFDLFDYNELFNLYSTKLTQNLTASESWSDSGTMYASPLLSNDPDTVPKLKGEDEDEDTCSFIFQNILTSGSSRVLGHANPARWNLWTANSGVWGADDPEYNFVLDAKEYWNITDPDSTVLGMLYDKDEESLGVHYVGEGDYLFWVDENGYYTYDSAKSGAAYNQSDGRFYVYEDSKNAFFPYNDHTQPMSSSNGYTNYWFGMSMEVQFYLPSSTSSGTEEHPVNQVQGKDDAGNTVYRDMTFDFSGDDDIMIFVDDEMVVDMAGIHSTSYSRINFSTNTVTYSMGLDATGAPITTNENIKSYENNELNLSAGFHKLTVRYMERGASASNLKIQFNVAPTWEYDSWPVQTVTAEKVWQDSSGNEINPEDLPDIYKTTGVEVGLFDKVGEETDDEFGYTKDGNIYTVTFTDDSGVTRTYIYDDSGETPTLTYTEVSSEGTINGTDNQVDSEGRVVDKDGYVVAWLEDGYLHIRMDKQTLSEKNGWTYAWGMLDADGSYEVLELSGSSSYVTTSEKEDLTTYDYWSIIGETEIEENLSNPNFNVILTEAAQETTDTLGDTQEALGWVIVVTEDGELTSKQVKFSHCSTLFEVTTNGEEEGDPEGSWTTYYYSLMGVTSQSEIDALGSGAVWYLLDSGDSIENMGNAEEFYLYCLLDGVQYFLTLDSDGTSITVTTDEAEASLFYYDFLGELRVVRPDGSGRDRVVISADGKVSLDVAEDAAAANDVRFYTLTETDTTGFSFTAVNTFLPDITLEKVDSNTGEPLEGVTFSLKNGDGLYYAYLDKDTDEVVWKTDKTSLSTDEDGQIVFKYMADGTYTLTEEATPDGYLALPSSITITIKNGEIESAVWTTGGLASGYSSLINVDQDTLTITLKNLPEYELPNAGGPGVTWFYLAGGIMMAASGVLLAYRFRRKFTL